MRIARLLAGKNLVIACLAFLLGWSVFADLKPVSTPPSEVPTERKPTSVATTVEEKNAETDVVPPEIPPLCAYDELMTHVFTTSGFSVRFPISWDNGTSPTESQVIWANCALDGVPSNVYGEDGDLFTRWSTYDSASSAEAWFSENIERTEERVRETIEFMKQETEREYSIRDFGAERASVTIDGRKAIRYTTWGPPGHEGPPNKIREYVVAANGKIYHFAGFTPRGPHEDQALRQFDERVQTVRFEALNR